MGLAEPLQRFVPLPFTCLQLVNGYLEDEAVTLLKLEEFVHVLVADVAIPFVCGWELGLFSHVALLWCDGTC